MAATHNTQPADRSCSKLRITSQSEGRVHVTWPAFGASSVLNHVATFHLVHSNTPRLSAGAGTPAADRTIPREIVISVFVNSLKKKKKKSVEMFNNNLREFEEDPFFS